MPSAMGDRSSLGMEGSVWHRLPDHTAASSYTDVDEAVVAFQTGLDRHGSFTFIIDQFYPRLQRLLRKRRVPAEASDDVIQEVFLQALLGLDGFEGRSSLGAWIFGIAINVLARLYSVEKKYEPSEVAQLEAQARDDTGDLELALDLQFRSLLEKERKERLRTAIATLPEKMRFCLQLRLYQERSYNEIASLLRISPGTVGAHINEAKRRLSQILLAQENKEN